MCIFMVCTCGTLLTSLLTILNCFVVCRAGIDRNMCCGTHVSNLSQVQVGSFLEKHDYFLTGVVQIKSFRLEKVRIRLDDILRKYFSLCSAMAMSW